MAQNVMLQNRRKELEYSLPTPRFHQLGISNVRTLFTSVCAGAGVSGGVSPQRRVWQEQLASRCKEAEKGRQ